MDLMKVELDLTLAEDPRINEFESELEFGEATNTVVIRIKLINGTNVTELNYVLSENGVELVEEE